MSTTLRSARLKITQNFDQVQVQLFALTPLYEQLQLCSVEAGFPNEDLFTFACRTAFFGVISLETAPSSSFSDSQDSPFTVSSSSPLYDDQWDDKVTEISRNLVGFVYLISTQSPPYPPNSRGELSLGIILKEEHCQKGYAKEVVGAVLDHTFRNLNCQRVQAVILHTSSKARALKSFINMHFTHEGIRRRSFFSIIEQQWKDTTCLAILDTDWMNISKLGVKTAPPRTLWDEMLLRHQREREDLVRLEQEQDASFPVPKWLKRTASMETIRVDNTNSLTDGNDSSASDVEGEGSTNHSDSESDLEQSMPRRSLSNTSKGKEKRAALFGDSDADSSDSESEFAALMRPSLKVRRVSLEMNAAASSKYYPPFSRDSSESPSIATAPSPSPSPSLSPSRSESPLSSHEVLHLPSSDRLDNLDTWRSPGPRSRSSSISLESATGSEGYDSSALSELGSQWDMLSEAGSPSSDDEGDIGANGSSL